MPINPEIALSYRPTTQIDPQGAYNFVQQMRQDKLQNALLQQKMADAQQQNALAQQLRAFKANTDFSDPKNLTRLAAFDPEAANQMASMQSHMATAGKTRIEAAGVKAGQYRQMLSLVNNPNDAMLWIQMHHDDPDMQDSPVARMPLDVAMSRIPQDAAGFQRWKQMAVLGMDEYIKQNKPSEVRLGNRVEGITPAGETAWTRNVGLSPDEASRANRSKVDPMQYPLLAAAVADGRMSPDRVNSRNAGFLEQALTRNPAADLNAMAARGALMRNAGFQQKAISAEIIPEVLQNVVDAGKKLDFSDVKFVANLQKWTAGQLQDPKLTEYMTLRNDSLLSIAATMRLVGMSDYATKLEEEAAAPTMSPKQLDAWMSGQMKALSPRLKKLSGLSIDGSNSNAPAAAPAQKTVTRTGTIDGRKVIQYSDGSVEYAD